MFLGFFQAVPPSAGSFVPSKAGATALRSLARIAALSADEFTGTIGWHFRRRWFHEPCDLALDALCWAPSGGRRRGSTTLDLGTAGNAASWLITGAGAMGPAAYQVDIEKAGEISLTKDAEMDGKFVKEGSLKKFNGFWVANESFTLPSNASNVSLKFSGLFADDRVVLELNGHIIGNATFNGNSGSGVMSFPGPGTRTSRVRCPPTSRSRTKRTVPSRVKPICDRGRERIVLDR